MAAVANRQTTVTRLALLALAGAAAAAALVPAPAGAAGKGGSAAGKDAGTVTISGKAYRFNHMSTYLPGATIKVRELPKLSAITDANGDYELEVPDDANVTPYIDAGEDYNEIDLQTFHTRGEDIENANFQTPHDNEYKALAALLSVPMDADRRPIDCVVVTTVSARNVRGVPYETFHQRTPHGVAGATAEALPAVPGPIYFNEHVIPDRSETESSEDGGIIWSVVPPGAYRFVAEHPTTRFASFLATCAPGRIVNANPPWGMYELRAGEEPLGASVVAASVVKAKLRHRRKPRRLIRAVVRSGEAIDARVALRWRGKRIALRRFSPLGAPKRGKAGRGRIVVGVPRRARRGKANLFVALRDAAGERVRSKHRIKLPRTNAKRRRNRG